MTPDDDLSTPLGIGAAPVRRGMAPFAMPLAAAFLGIVLAVFVVWSLIGNDPLGGEPVVTVNAGPAAEGVGLGDKRPASAPNAEESPAPMRSSAAASSERTPARGPFPREPAAPTQGKPPEPADPTEQIVTIIDGKSGARQEVRVHAPAEPVVGSGDSQLVEMTRNGPIPRIGADGLRAAQAYARPFQAKPNSPQIAIVIAGLGVSANVTTDAINKLPGAVTFASSRPMEPTSSASPPRRAASDTSCCCCFRWSRSTIRTTTPARKLSLTSLSSEQNIERLQWAMSRFPGYVGISNQMGARFSASELSFSAIMREIGRRGLIYVDDGSSPRSLASQIAGGNSLAFTKANLVLDAVPSPAEIDRALSRLEAIARGSGIAVGFASSLPVSIERISLWAKTAESRGFTLAPITVAAARTKSS